MYAGCLSRGITGTVIVTLFEVVLLIDVLMINNKLSTASSIFIGGSEFVRVEVFENLTPR